MRISKLSALAVLLLAPLSTLPLESARAEQPETQTQEDPSSLQLAMKSLNTGQRGLRKLIADPVANKDAIMGYLTDMERAILGALKETPPRPEGVSDAELPLFNVRFKRTLTSLLQQVFAMAEANLEGDTEALGTAYAELGTVKKSGHKNFRDR